MEKDFFRDGVLRRKKKYTDSSDSKKQENFRQETDKTEQEKQDMMEKLWERIKKYMEEKEENVKPAADCITKEEFEEFKDDYIRFKNASVNLAGMTMEQQCSDDPARCEDE